ncbi:MAG: hypothetical protein ABJ007_10170 [Pseudophaeobacter sp.]|uniref:hypothetical protein n=1 Tax=Pseudophaeobacter sp. TaxID=1971739 RepID=UPI003298DDF4
MTRSDTVRKSRVLVGFADDCRQQIEQLPGAQMVFADARFGKRPVCLPADLQGEIYAATSPEPTGGRFNPDLTARARAYGAALDQAIDAGCGVAQFTPPSDPVATLPCLIEALDRLQMRTGQVSHPDITAFPPETRKWAKLIVAGRGLARSITEATPEQPVTELAAIVAQALSAAGAETELLSGDAIQQSYPLCAAVSAATQRDPDRRPAVLRVRIGRLDAPRALFCAGKGVVMDTGGIDLKPAGQFGMSRDKGGAGTLAGFLLAAATACPEDLCIHAEIGFAWNGIGASAITADHCLTSAAGVRLQVGNTDAEGRLILSDLLCSLLAQRQQVSAAQADFIALATLTGHAARAFGQRSVLIGDDYWQQSQRDQALLQSCESVGERAAVSPLCPEDWAAVMPTAAPVELVGGKITNSIATVRGHQYPVAVIKTAAGWFNAPRPEYDGFLLADIAGANKRGDLPGARAACPMVGALVARYLMGSKEQT